MSARRTFLTFLIGLALIQSAWIIATPAFRGPDEFDHVYRAEGVSHGAFLPGPSIPTSGRGELTPARTSVIDAASPVCASYPYTRYYNCHPWLSRDRTWNQAASGAGRYNPSYYLVVGTVGRFFTGAGVDYAIRVATALAAALLLAWAASIWTRSGSSRWRSLGLMTAISPVLMFSTTIAAPNGISYAAGVLLWVAGLDLLRPSLAPPRPQSLTAMAIAAVLLCNTHTTGPLWLLLIGVTFLIIQPRRAVGLLHHRRTWSTLGVMALGAAASVTWTLLAQANLADQPVTVPGSPVLGELVPSEILWLLQAIAVFPLRNEPAPFAVYGLWLIPFAVILGLALRRRGRSLAAFSWVTVAAIGTATALTFASYNTDGYAWQGRYSLPLTVGLVLVPTGLTKGKDLLGPLFDCLIVSIAAAAALSVWHVADKERHFVVQPWSTALPAGAVLVGLLAAAGSLLMARALHRSGPATAVAADQEHHREAVPA